MEMSIKEFFSGTTSWLRGGRMASPTDIDEDGLISREDDSVVRIDSLGETEHGPDVIDRDEESRNSNEVLVKTITPMDKHPGAPGLEKLQDGLNRLVEQLRGINENLNRQGARHEELMGRIEQLPHLLQGFPGIVENQRQITEQLIQQLKENAIKDQQFMDAVAKIPTETARQTDALVNIDHQLAAAADNNVQMVENFNKFNQSLEKLDESSLSQTDSIMQMSKTFAASDRYLKYIISRQNKRFLWVMASAVGVCIVVVAALVGIIIYLTHGQ
jgi:hypothetical protein